VAPAQLPGHLGGLVLDDGGPGPALAFTSARARVLPRSRRDILGTLDLLLISGAVIVLSSAEFPGFLNIGSDNGLPVMNAAPAATKPLVR